MTQEEKWIKTIIKDVNKNLWYQWNPSILNPYRNHDSYNHTLSTNTGIPVRFIRKIKKML